MQNPFHHSTITTDPKSPTSSPQRPPSDETNPTTQNFGGAGGGGTSGVSMEALEKMKTPLEVLAELASSESPGSDVGHGYGYDGGVNQSGASLAMTVGGSMVMVQEEVGGEGRGKKRKCSDVKDPPIGTPSCPLCFKEFLSWKGAFGHMRKHPDRDYRGFYKPPAFSSSTSTAREALGHGQGNGGENSNGENKSREDGMSSPIQGVVFDLNQPMGGAGSSNAAERNEAPVSPPPEPKEKIDDEGKKLGVFDLNELPTNNEDE